MRPRTFRAAPLLAGSALGIALAAGPLLAQSLAEVAARDRDRRARMGSPSPRVFTDDDLRKDAVETSPSPSPSPSPGASPAARPKGWKAPSPDAPLVGSSPAPTPLPERDRAADEARWRAMARERRDAVAAAEARVAALKARLVALRNDLGPTGTGDPFRQQTLQAETARATTELEAAQANLVRARQALADLEDDARRAGALPGWVR